MNPSTMSASIPALPFAFDPLIAEAKQRARRRRSVALAAIALLGIAAVVALLRPFGGPGTRVVSSDGISMQIPSGWFFTRRPLTPGITGPMPRFVVSSYRIPGSAFRGYGASYYLPSSSGVLAYVMEQFPADLRPVWKPLSELRLGRLGPAEVLTGRRWAEFTFRLHGRDFYAFMWIGRHASPSQRNGLLGILEGMTAK